METARKPCHQAIQLLLETKYRDIADGNFVARGCNALVLVVGNQVPRYSGWKRREPLVLLRLAKTLETKYRDIADGNVMVPVYCGVLARGWKPSTAI